MPPAPAARPFTLLSIVETRNAVAARPAGHRLRDEIEASVDLDGRLRHERDRAGPGELHRRGRVDGERVENVDVDLRAIILLESHRSPKVATRPATRKVDSRPCIR